MTKLLRNDIAQFDDRAARRSRFATPATAQGGLVEILSWMRHCTLLSHYSHISVTLQSLLSHCYTIVLHRCHATVKLVSYCCNLSVSLLTHQCHASAGVLFDCCPTGVFTD